MHIHDLLDPTDPHGRTYGEVNGQKPHAYAIGQLVEREDGVRLFVVRHGRDCNGTPLHTLGIDEWQQVLFGVPAESLRSV